LVAAADGEEQQLVFLENLDEAERAAFEAERAKFAAAVREWWAIWLKTGGGRSFTEASNDVGTQHRNMKTESMRDVEEVEEKHGVYAHIGDVIAWLDTKCGWQKAKRGLIEHWARVGSHAVDKSFSQTETGASFNGTHSYPPDAERILFKNPKFCKLSEAVQAEVFAALPGLLKVVEAKEGLLLRQDVADAVPSLGIDVKTDTLVVNRQFARILNLDGPIVDRNAVRRAKMEKKEAAEAARRAKALARVQKKKEAEEKKSTKERERALKKMKADQAAATKKLEFMDKGHWYCQFPACGKHSVKCNGWFGCDADQCDQLWWCPKHEDACNVHIRVCRHCPHDDDAEEEEEEQEQEEEQEEEEEDEDE
jgi:hypothetical protein